MGWSLRVREPMVVPAEQDVGFMARTYVTSSARRAVRAVDSRTGGVRLSSNTSETNTTTMTALPLLPAAPLATPGRANMRDVTGGTTPGVEIKFDARTAFDFVYSLDQEAGSTDDLPTADRKWLHEERAKLPGPLRDLPQHAGAISRRRSSSTTPPSPRPSTSSSTSAACPAPRSPRPSWPTTCARGLPAADAFGARWHRGRDRRGRRVVAQREASLPRAGCCGSPTRRSAT